MRFLLLLTLIHIILIVKGNDSIYLKVLTNSNNLRFKITRFDDIKNHVLLDTSFGSKNFKIFEIGLPTDSIIINNKLRLYFWVKKKYWFGWQKFLILDDYEYIPTNKVLSIYSSDIHKRKFRYVHKWKSMYFLN